VKAGDVPGLLQRPSRASRHRGSHAGAVRRRTQPRSRRAGSLRLAAALPGPVRAPGRRLTTNSPPTRRFPMILNVLGGAGPRRMRRVGHRRLDLKSGRPSAPVRKQAHETHHRELTPPLSIPYLLRVLCTNRNPAEAGSLVMPECKSQAPITLRRPRRERPQDHRAFTCIRASPEWHRSVAAVRRRPGQ
jgi:hypothetical protein